MKRCIGQEITVILKSSKNLHGMLIEFNEEDAIIQIGHKSVFIPRKNVEYYEAVNINSGSNIVGPPSGTKLGLPTHNEILVKVDGNLVTTLAVDPSVNISSCTPDLLDMILENTDVQDNLSNKVMLKAEYDMGDLNIVTEKPPTIAKKEIQNTFQAPFGPIQEGYKSQIEMLVGKRK